MSPPTFRPRRFPIGARSAPGFPSRRTATLLAAALLVGACDGRLELHFDDEERAREWFPSELVGVWEQAGYGNLYVISDTTIETWEITRAHCLPAARAQGIPGVPPERNGSLAVTTLGDGSVSLRVPGEAFPRLLTPLGALPARCGEPLDASPMGVVETLWRTFDERYAFFALRGVDWDAQLVEARASLAMLGDEVDEAALFELLATMLAPLDDGHVSLDGAGRAFSPAALGGIGAALVEGFAAREASDDFERWSAAIIARWESVIRSYLDERSVGEVGALVHARIDDATGYLFIDSMIGYSFDLDAIDEEEDLDAIEGLSLEGEVEAAGRAIDTALAALGDIRHLIVDVRFNGGGLDAVALALAERFADTERTVLAKYPRSRDGWRGRSVEAALAAVAEPFLGDVTLLTGPDTASAAEVFAVAMRQLPQVTLVGQPTDGALSDVLEKTLPNGWSVGLSNEVYRDAEGIAFEGHGVPPDESVRTFDLDDVEAGRDAAIEYALARADGAQNSRQPLELRLPVR